MLNDARILHAVIAVLIGFLALAAVGIVVIANDAANAVQDSQLKACKEVNNPNRETSSRNTEQFKGFILDAVKTRRDDGDHEAADRYQSRADRIKPLIVPSCEELFPEP